MRWIPFILSLPWTLTVGYGWVLLMRCFAARDLRMDKNGTLRATWKPWVVKPRGKKQKPLWRYSTTLGHGIIYQPHVVSAPGNPETVVEEHENVHVRQSDDLMATSFVIGLVVALISMNPWLGLGVWWSGGAWQLVHMLTGACRFGFFTDGGLYRQTEHERSARAQTSYWARDGESWLVRERKRMKN